MFGEVFLTGASASDIGCAPASFAWTNIERAVYRDICTYGDAELSHMIETQNNRNISGNALSAMLSPNYGATRTRDITIEGANIIGPLYVSGISQRLSLTNDHFSDVTLADSNPADVNISNSTLGRFSIYNVNSSAGIHIEDVRGRSLNGSFTTRGDLTLARSTFDSVSLPESQIGGNLYLLDSSLNSLTMSFSRIGGVSFLSHIRGQSSFKNNGFTKLFMHKFAGSGDVYVEGGSLDSIDFSGASIAGKLALRSSKQVPIIWGPGQRLTLSNASISELSDDDQCLPLLADASTTCLDPWPATLQLTGFVYQSLDDGLLTRDIAWWRHWLSSNRSASIQPYDQLAGVLRQAGLTEQADAIEIAGFDVQRDQAPVLKKLWLVLYDSLSGYGRHSERVLYWTFAFLLLGVIVLRVSGEGKRLGMPYGVSLSFDRLIPVVSLRKSNDDVELVGWAKYYFYLHRLLGFVLASLIVAGVAGLEAK